MTDQENTEVVEPSSNPRNEFWDRDDVRGARNALDVWASCRWARYEHADLPSMETIFEHPEAEFAKYWDEAHKTWREGDLLGCLPFMRPVDSKEALIEFSIDHVLESCGQLATAVLHRLYPRVGPYAQQQYLRGMEDPEGSILRKFRPTRLIGELRSRYLDRDLVSLYNRLHRESILEVARICTLPAEVFACEIERIIVPPKPKAERRKKVRHEQEPDVDLGSSQVDQEPIRPS